jgi:hypothetical protein
MWECLDEYEFHSLHLMPFRITMSGSCLFSSSRGIITITLDCEVAFGAGT